MIAFLEIFNCIELSIQHYLPCQLTLCTHLATCIPLHLAHVDEISHFSLRTMFLQFVFLATLCEVSHLNIVGGGDEL